MNVGPSVGPTNFYATSAAANESRTSYTVQHTATIHEPHAESSNTSGQQRVNSNTDRARIFAQHGLSPQYVRGSKSTFQLFKDKDWREVKDRLKQAWIQGQWNGMVQSTPANTTINALVTDLLQRIDSAENPFSIPDKLKGEARKYIEAKRNDPSYFQSKDGVLFSHTGTSLETDIVISRKGLVFRKVKKEGTSLIQRVAKEQGVSAQISTYLGKGSFGEVRLFENLTTDGSALVAGKSPSAYDNTGAPTSTNTVLPEYELSEKLPRTQYFPKMREYASVAGREFFFMDLQARGTLEAAVLDLTQRDDLTADQCNIVARTLAYQAVSGVREMHQAGVYHCDIKPENLLVAKTGTLVVADLGSGSRSVRPVESIGTDGFRAPETYRDSHHRAQLRKDDADKFSLGATLEKIALCASGTDASALHAIAGELKNKEPSMRPSLDNILQNSYFTGQMYSDQALLKIIDRRFSN